MNRWAAYEREPCLTCGACVGVHCVTTSGKRSATPHLCRIMVQHAKEGRVHHLPTGGFKDVVDR